MADTISVQWRLKYGETALIVTALSHYRDWLLETTQTAAPNDMQALKTQLLRTDDLLRKIRS